jgi:hypothetical protein
MLNHIAFVRGDGEQNIINSFEIGNWSKPDSGEKLRGD